MDISYGVIGFTLEEIISLAISLYFLTADTELGYTCYYYSRSNRGKILPCLDSSLSFDMYFLPPLG